MGEIPVILLKFSVGPEINSCFLLVGTSLAELLFPPIRVEATTRFSKLVQAYLCAGKNRRHFSLAQLSRIWFLSDPELFAQVGFGSGTIEPDVYPD